jgi:multidrug transporter EmrE-like cation transporter
MNKLVQFFDVNTIYLVILSIIEIGADFSLERYANFGGSTFLTLGSVGYAGVVYFLIQALRGSTILYINNMWDGISSIIETLAAYFLLGERFEHPRQYLGVILIVLGMFMLHR